MFNLNNLYLYQQLPAVAGGCFFPLAIAIQAGHHSLIFHIIKCFRRTEAALNRFHLLFSLFVLILLVVQEEYRAATTTGPHSQPSGC